MSEQRIPRLTGRLVAGSLLILLGLLFTLDNFGVIDAGQVWDYWPLILIGVGLAKVVSRRRADQRMGGVILILVGGLFLLRTLHIAWFRFHDVWPFLLLLAGGAMIWQGVSRKRSPLLANLPENPGERALAGARAGLEATREWRGGGPVEAGAVLNEFAFMGGGDRVVRVADFRGGEVTAIMGGFQIDLRGASIAGDSATIEVFTLWGGVDIRVPEDWSVVVKGVPLLGVFSHSGRAVGEGAPSGKTLIVKGVAIMGGVEVKN